jgi:hypothetical protein
MPEELSSEHLREVTTKMIQAISSPPYVEAMRAIKSAPKGRRLDEALRRLTPEALRAEGVPLPEGMRISSRYFESGYVPIELGDVPEGQSNVFVEFNKNSPGALARLYETNPDLYKNAVNRLAGMLLPVPDLPPAAFCGCACGGAATVCGGAGGG